jgi:RNA polymerase sigma-70 factor (ECF subfamily)
VEHDERRARFEVLFAAHSAAVLAYARRRGDAATADDVLGEVFLVAWRRLDQIPADQRPWLLACARRVLANSRRSQRRRDALIDRLIAVRSRPSAEPEIAEGDVVRALAGLGERDREALMLVAWEGLSAEQAARVLGCSRHAFTVRLQRARRRLTRAVATTENLETHSLQGELQ